MIKKSKPENNIFREKYRVDSARLPNHDYSQNGVYFVTICTKNREHFFGRIIKNKMRLSIIGRIADNYWQKIPHHFPFVLLGEWIVMPDHIHGIIVIDKNNIGGVGNNVLRENTIVETPKMVETPKLGVSRVVTETATEMAHVKMEPQKIYWKPGVLGVIVNQYKRVCTIKIHQLFSDFGWQSRFHDHIIRNKNEWNRISKYIIDNPYKWNKN